MMTPMIYMYGRSRRLQTSDELLCWPGHSQIAAPLFSESAEPDGSNNIFVGHLREKLRDG